MELYNQDLVYATRRLPKNLLDIMTFPEWEGKIFIGGGYIRSVITNEPVNDVDVFVQTKKDAELLAYKLCKDKNDIIETENTYTIKGKLPIQIIHRWLFDKPEDVANSFDFSVCCAVLYYKNRQMYSYCIDSYYIDLASKRLRYLSPKRNEDAGGSMIRVLKYYNKGYRIPLDSLASVIARLVQAVDFNRVDAKNEIEVAHIITGLLREVDPSIDPTQISYMEHSSMTDEYGNKQEKIKKQ